MSHTIVIFGATGDLAREKLFPALMRLYHDGGLTEDTHIIGFSRREWTNVHFHDHIKPYLDTLGTESEVSSFLKSISYHKGEFADIESYNNLSKKVKGSALVYLSIAPDNYKTVINTIKDSKFKEIFKNKKSKILIEKPFGLDVISAQALDTLLLSVCLEEQIYRIDHYLAKFQVMNILRLKLENSAFDDVISSETLSRIHIRIFETKDIGTRGASYDKVGALIDVGQNHLLEILATLIMRPTASDHESVRTARLEALQKLVFVDINRGQYEGYRGHAGVSADSETETYFKLLLQSHDEKLRGVDLILEAGKAMNESVADITLTTTLGHHMRIEIQPNVSAEGLGAALMPALSKSVAKKGREAYEELFYDAFKHDDRLFPSLPEILAAWTIIDEAKKASVLSELVIYQRV